MVLLLLLFHVSVTNVRRFFLSVSHTDPQHLSFEDKDSADRTILY